MNAIRFTLGLLHYIAGLVFIYGATSMAPNMNWPHTAIEWIAADLLFLGLASVIVGAIYHARLVR